MCSGEFMIMPRSEGNMSGMAMGDMDKMALASIDSIAPGETKMLDYPFPSSAAGSCCSVDLHPTRKRREMSIVGPIFRRLLAARFLLPMPPPLAHHPRGSEAGPPLVLQGSVP
jgi:hypothetical protein